MLKQTMFAAALMLGTAAEPALAQTATQQASATMQMDHISVQAIGAGDPIILIPGLSTPRNVWDGVAPDLAKSHRVYLVQVNGFGGGDPGANLKPGILDGVVADLATFIRDHKLEKPAMVGHSMGGLAALMFAKAHPDQVSRVMVVDALPFIGALFVPGSTVDTIEPLAVQMRDRMRTKQTSQSAEATARTMAVKAGSRAQVAQWVLAADPRVASEAMYEDMTTDLRGDMATIETPITLVYPHNEYVPLARADPLYRGQYQGVANMQFVPVGDSGHFVMLDQPEAFARALNEFLAD